MGSMGYQHFAIHLATRKWQTNGFGLVAVIAYVLKREASYQKHSHFDLDDLHTDPNECQRPDQEPTCCGQRWAD